MNVLNFPGVRTIMLDGTPWFVRIDLNDLLGLDRGSVPKDWTDGDKRLVGGTQVPVKTGQTRSIGGGHARKFLVITPAAAYRLAMRSDKPQAVQFQRWLSEEVLPSIEQHGIYVQGQEALKDDPEAFQALVTKRANEMIEHTILQHMRVRDTADAAIAALSAIQLAA